MNSATRKVLAATLLVLPLYAANLTGLNNNAHWRIKKAGP